jgi:hypothetical protein
MKNKIQAILIVSALLVVCSYGSFSVPKALADPGTWCDQPQNGQKVAAGNGPSASDESSNVNTGHCNSWVNIDSVTQSGTTLYVVGEIEGGGITSYCTPYNDPNEQDPYISEVDSVLAPTFGGSGPYAFDYKNSTGNASMYGYDGKGNQLTFDDISVDPAPSYSQACGTGPIDQDGGTGGYQEYASFTYHIDLSSGYQNGQTYTTYVHIIPGFNGTYEGHSQQSIDYSDNYQQYTYQQCAAMGWSTQEDCRDYWAYATFIPTGLATTPTTGTINVKSDRPTSWEIGNCGSCNAQSSTSATYSNVTGGQSYLITDSSGNNLNSSGFSISNNNPLVLQDKPSLLARVVHSVDAASSSCSNSGFTCYLAAGGTASFNLVSNYCSLTIQTQVNGANQALSGLNYTLSGGPSSGPQTLTSTPQTMSMVADPTNGSSFTVTKNTDPTSWHGYTLDPTNSVTGTSVSCVGGNSTTITENYVTRATLQIH